MLKSRRNIKTLLAIVTGALALTVSIPNSGSISLISPALANQGGGGSGGGDGSGINNLLDRMQTRRANNFRAVRFKRFKSRRKARVPRWRIKRAERIARQKAKARARAARKKAIADRMRARRKANAMARDVRRMFGMDFNNNYMSTTDREGNTTTVGRDRFGDPYKIITLPGAAPAPVAAPLPVPVPAPVPAPNAPWASSTNPATGITTKSIRLPNGTHLVTLTNAQGIPVNQFITQR